MSSHKELWKDVDVSYDYGTGALEIRDGDDDSIQLGLFIVMEED